MTFENVRLAVRSKSSISIGVLFGESLALFQKVWLQGLLLQVLTILVLYGLTIILYIPMLGAVFVMDESSIIEDAMPMVIFTMVLFLFYAVVFLAVVVFQVGLIAAFYRIMRLRDRGLTTEKGVNFGMFFKKKYLLKLTLIGLINLVMITIASVLFVIPVFFVIIPIQFVILFFAFHPELSLKELYILAFSLGINKWGSSFVVFAGLFLFSLVGMFLCFIGVLATVSIAFIPVYLVYKEVVGFREVEDDIESIGRI